MTIATTFDDSGCEALITIWSNFSFQHDHALALVLITDQTSVTPDGWPQRSEGKSGPWRLPTQATWQPGKKDGLAIGLRAGTSIAVPARCGGAC